MQGDFDILTAVVAGVGVGALAVLVVIGVRLRLERQRWWLEKLRLGEQHATIIANTYTEIGDCQAKLEPSAALYQLGGGKVGIAIMLLLTEADARCIRHQMHNGRDVLEGWANRVALGASIGLGGEDFRITLTAPLTPLATIFHAPHGETRVALTPQHTPDFGE